MVMSKWFRRTWIEVILLAAAVGALSSEGTAWAKHDHKHRERPGKHDCTQRERPGKHDHTQRGRPSKHNDDGTWRVVNTSGRAPSGRSAPAVGVSGRWVYVF